MKILVVVALLFAFVISVSAGASCSAIGGSCVGLGPVSGTYTDNKCKNFVPTHAYLDPIFDPSQAFGGQCIPDNTRYTSIKWNCGIHLVVRSYTQLGCKGPSSVETSFTTGKCVQTSDNPVALYTKIMCASASTASFSVALVTLLAVLALLF